MAGMNRTTAVRAIITATRHQPVIFTSGDVSRIARDIADRPTHFYLAGSNGLASSTGIGVALQTHGTTVVVDGYGSVLTNLAGLVTAGMLTDLPLVHIVLDDAWYASEGGEAARGSRADLCGMARAAGYARVHTVDTLDGFVRVIKREIATCTAPVFLRCALHDGDDRPATNRAGLGYLDNTLLFPGHRAWPPDWITSAAA
jgi:thiamine pyrophosphate-dependent acetolactate synthase large subunit-like protein